MFLLKYTSQNSSGYYLVHEKTEEKAIEKLKKHLFFLSLLHVESATI